MTKPKLRILLSFALVITASFAASAQTRIQVAQGRRSIQDKVTFGVEVIPDKRAEPRYATAPEDLQIFVRFTDRPATGKVFIDGKAVGRFDETMGFNSNLLDISYGRHTISMSLAAPSVMTDFVISVRGGSLREILDDQEPQAVGSANLEKRIVELEQRVHDLENEIGSLKRKRQH